jgi:channel protein (hemolysin III family)
MPVHPLPGFFEPISAISHLGAAIVFGVLGIRLIRRSRGERLRLAFISVFVFAGVFMLSMSGVFHMMTGGGAAWAVMFRMDKAAIFVLIAGTFTPVHGLLFTGFIRWAGLAAMWGAAVTGLTLVTIFFDDMPFGLGTTLYLTLGWIAGLSIFALWRRHGFRFVRAILAGGLAYSVGAILLGLKWPTLMSGVFGPHELWHVAVIVGLSLHWRFIARLAKSAQTTHGRLVANVSVLAA